MSQVTLLLSEQIQHEFTASQQYLAFAVWIDQQALPQLAGRFYQQSLEERNHALMIVQYLMDRDIEVAIPAVSQVNPPPDSVPALLQEAVTQEKEVTRQFEAIVAAARAENDFLSEQFVHWFLKEQVEEVASMSTLLQVAIRCGENLMLLEDYLARQPASGADVSAPPAAGGVAGPA